MLRMRKLASMALLPLVALMGIADAPASAATATTTFSVGADVSITCQLSAGTLTFGTYTGAQLDATSTISVTCSNGTTYSVGLDAGGSGGTVTTRAMLGPSSAHLNYALYSDASHTINWGNTPPTDTVAGTGTGSAQSLTVYGRVAGGQFPAGGSYTDTITATVTY